MRSSGDYDYCKVFVRSADAVVVRRLVEGAVSGTVEGRVLRLEGVEVEVRRNPVAAAEGAAGTDFLYWPLQVEFDGGDGVRPALIVEPVRATLTALWDARIDAVAAADFEHELPWSGGIRRPLTVR